MATLITKTKKKKWNISPFVYCTTIVAPEVKVINDFNRGEIQMKKGMKDLVKDNLR